MVFGYIVKDCPNAWFMASLRYDQFFKTFDVDSAYLIKCPYYWWQRGEPVLALRAVSEVVTHYTIPGSNSVMELIADNQEDLEAKLWQGKQVIYLEGTQLEPFQGPLPRYF